MNPVNNLIFVSVGGTGLKVLESLIHLASSGNGPKQIIPIIIDQDSENGNKKRAVNVIKTYMKMRRKIKEIDKGNIFFDPNIELDDVNNLEPYFFIPEDIRNNFQSAVNYMRMNDIEKKMLDSLFTSEQMTGKLDHGFKKRAFLGSILMNKMLINQSKLDYTAGLNKIVDQFKKLPKDQLHVVICGSIFGGTGASGIVKIGGFFKKNLPDHHVKAIMLLPYFKVSTDWEDGDADKGLINSNNDMISSKIVLSMYKDEIRKNFDSVYFLGTTLPNDKVSDIAYTGGDKQENKEHIFELLSAIGAAEYKNSNNFEVNNYNFESNAQQIPQRFEFSMKNILNKEYGNNNSLKLLELANLIVNSEKYGDDWINRQPWFISKNEEDLNLIKNWAASYSEFWKQLSHKDWQQFYLDSSETNDDFGLSAKLSINLPKNVKNSKNIAHLFMSLQK